MGGKSRGPALAALARPAPQSPKATGSFPSSARLTPRPLRAPTAGGRSKLWSGSRRGACAKYLRSHHSLPRRRAAALIFIHSRAGGPRLSFLAYVPSLWYSLDMDSMPRKYPWHDFQRPGNYLFTITMAPSCRERLATIDPAGAVHETPLGSLVRVQWEQLATETAGLLAIHAFQLMPDHIHAQVEIVSRLPQPIGFYIARFKALSTGRARRRLNFPKDAPLWAPAYDWRKKTTTGEIETARAYVENNPVQHILKQQAKASFGQIVPLSHPRLPRSWPDSPNDRTPLAWKAFGNSGLLDGDSWALHVSRRTCPADFDALIEQALDHASAGRVCISPAISPGERKVFQTVIQSGGKAIHLVSVPLTPRYHPASWAMEAFAAGRFLVLSPIPESDRVFPLSRVLALHLNACAAEIARNKR